MKNICVLIANRTNYSKIKPILCKLSLSKKVKINIILCSSAIIPKYGNLIELIQKDGFEISFKIDSLLMNDGHASMAISSGISMVQHATFYQNNEIDSILTVGDRFDMLTPVLAAKYMNIPIFHLQGGERSGSIDDTIRNLISLCSDYHFVATEKSLNNLISLGIDEKRIFNFGCTAVEYLINNLNSFKNNNEIKLSSGKLINLDLIGDYLVVLIHPNTTCDDLNIDLVFNAIDRFNYKIFLFYPNVDASNSVILSSIQRKLNDSNYFIIKNLKLDDFGLLLSRAVCFIGNSSSGIRESASFRIPFVNIGSRQSFREQNSNTINCSSEESAIFEAINKAISIKGRLVGDNVYYKKHSAKLVSQKIISIVYEK
jgi:UDP-hydrolysing UDP-N-acetyl-D-glucosamine 2-epimerase